MSARNWQEMGIKWLEEKVSRMAGTTKVEIRGMAQIPHIENLELAIAHFGAERVMEWVNGTSLRVTAQAVNRANLPEVTGEALRELIYQRMMGTRVRSVGRRTVKVYTLPNGTQYTGEDLVEYRQLFVAALVDMGVDNEKAIQMATAITL